MRCHLRPTIFTKREIRNNDGCSKEGHAHSEGYSRVADCKIDGIVSHGLAEAVAAQDYQREKHLFCVTENVQIR